MKENNINEKNEALTPDEITVSAVNSEKKPAKKQKFFKSRGFKYGTVATVMTALVIVVVIAVNMVFSVLTDAYSWAIDFTSTGMYDISDETKQVVNSLDPSVEIEVTVFYDETDYPYYLSEPLKRFVNLSDNIKINYIDPEKNPSALTQYGNEYNVQAGAVVVKNGDRIRVFNVNDYYSVDNDTGAIYIYIEERLAAGTLYVTREDIPVVYFLTGHGEDGYQNLMNLIANNGADVKEINLLTDKEEFSENAKLMVICNPTRDYSIDEIRKISDFAINDNLFGKNIMYFSSTDAVDLPNIENFLKTWGVALNDDIVLDTADNTFQNFQNALLPTFTSEEIMNTGAKLSTVTTLLAPNSRSITKLFTEDGLYKTQSIISTSDTSYSRASDAINQDLERDPTDKSGPFDLGVLSMMYKYINNIQVQSYLLACGSVDMIESNYFTYTGNGEMFMQLYKIMMDEKDDTILAAQKATSSSVAAISSSQANTMMVVTVIVIPALFLILGLVIYIRRRFL